MRPSTFGPGTRLNDSSGRAPVWRLDQSLVSPAPGSPGITAAQNPAYAEDRVHRGPPCGLLSVLARRSPARERRGQPVDEPRNGRPVGIVIGVELTDREGRDGWVGQERAERLECCFEGEALVAVRVLR
jgi:hypothetical protein